MDKSQQWELFGYDVRRLGKQWLAAWRNLLWEIDSPVRSHLDEVVCLHEESRTALYQSGSPASEAPYECHAVLLPEHLALTRMLKLPLAVEGDLAAALAMELNANSPFSTDDSAMGWQVVDRDESQLHVAMVIVSRSAVMAWLGGEYDIHDPAAREVWADVEGHKVVVQGFGERRRESRYRRRLLRSSIIVAVCAALILLIAAVAAGTKRAELSRVEALALTTQREASDASQMRSRVALASETLSAVQSLKSEYPSPHFELARLTRLLGDGTHIVQFTMRGREMRLRGRAEDAASVMQLLTKEPDYTEVTAPQAIIKVANSKLEQFSLNVVLGDGESP